MFSKSFNKKAVLRQVRLIDKSILKLFNWNMEPFKKIEEETNKFLDKEEELQKLREDEKDNVGEEMHNLKKALETPED